MICHDCGKEFEGKSVPLVTNTGKLTQICMLCAEMFNTFKKIPKIDMEFCDFCGHKFLPSELHIVKARKVEMKQCRNCGER